MENPVTQRIVEIIEHLGISRRKFAESINVPQSTLMSSYIRNSDFRSSHLSSIIESYPNINAEWLLTGKGSMIKSSPKIEPEVIKSNIPDSNLDQITIPRAVWDLIERQSKSMEAQINSFQDQAKAMTMQAESLKTKDDQIQDLINKLKNQKGGAADAGNVVRRAELG